jgi:hypothetical protein
MYSKKTPDDGQRKCPKHVEFFFDKIKFGKFVRLVGFIKKTAVAVCPALSVSVSVCVCVPKYFPGCLLDVCQDTPYDYRPILLQ